MFVWVAARNPEKGHQPLPTPIVYKEQVRAELIDAGFAGTLRKESAPKHFRHALRHLDVHVVALLFVRKKYVAAMTTVLSNGEQALLDFHLMGAFGRDPLLFLHAEEARKKHW